MFNKYLELYEELDALKIFLSIGLHVWVTLLVMYMAILRKNKQMIFFCLLPLSVIATLMIATPVFAEFRYAYILLFAFFGSNIIYE